MTTLNSQPLCIECGQPFNPKTASTERCDVCFYRTNVKANATPIRCPGCGKLFLPRTLGASVCSVCDGDASRNTGPESPISTSVECDGCGKFFQLKGSWKSKWCPDCRERQRKSRREQSRQTGNKKAQHVEPRPVECHDCGSVFKTKWWGSAKWCPACKEKRKEPSRKSVGPQLVTCHGCGKNFDSLMPWRAKWCPHCKKERAKARNREENKLWRERHPERSKASKERWREKSKDQRREYKRHYDRKARKDPVVRLVNNIRSTLAAALKRAKQRGQGVVATGGMRYVGCTVEELVVHLEAQFVDGMTWENHGVDGWHVDHIFPLSKADLTDPAQLRAAFDWRNLRPAWAAENFEKSDKILPEAEEAFWQRVEEFAEEGREP